MINEPDISREVEVHPHIHIPYKRISWSAILVGALIALGLSFLLNLFGLAIGLSAFSAATSTGQETIAMGALLGLLVGTIATMLVAGYTAGFLGRFYCPRRNLGILYGFSTWTLSLILGALITLPLANFAHISARGVTTTPSVSVEATKPTATDNKVSVQKQTSPTVKNQEQQNVDVKAPAEALAWGTFSIFLLFFVGAVFSCIGAHWGMSCKRDD